MYFSFSEKGFMKTASMQQNHSYSLSNPLDPLLKPASILQIVLNPTADPALGAQQLSLEGLKTSKLSLQYGPRGKGKKALAQFDGLVQ
jgi:hypothetical protein